MKGSYIEMKFPTKIFCVLAFVSFFCVETYSQVTVKKSAMDRNPSLFFKGISGNEAFSTQVGSDLKNCGWFDVTGGAGTTDYSIEGISSGASATIVLKDGTGAAVFSFKTDASQGRKSAHLAVDSILKKVFGIDGICSTKIAFAGEIRKGVKEIFICDFDGADAKKVTSNGTLSVEPGWIPGRDAIAYVRYGKMSMEVLEYDIPSTRSRRLVQFPGLNASFSFAPNGKVMAMVLSRDRQVELYLKALNSAAFQRLTTSKSVEASPCWSPDGRRICYVSDQSGRPGLYIMNATGGPSTRLPTQGSEAVTPAWSKDNKIVYSARMGKSYTLAMLDLNGKEAQRILINMAGDWESPSWAPDNRHIVCSRTSGGKSSLYIVDTLTGKIRPLISSGTSTMFPSWSGILK